jgi:putative flavoprotein involved in K+ transport
VTSKPDLDATLERQVALPGGSAVVAPVDLGATQLRYVGGRGVGSCEAPTLAPLVVEMSKPRMDASTKQHEVVVIGAGQTGLAMGYFLSGQRRDFTILEAAREPASAWRERWDSLKLFTPARYSGLPGLAFPGDPQHYPSRNEVAAYLAEYAEHFGLPVELESRVRRVGKSNGAYSVELDDRRYEAEQVVIATGPFQVPFTPPIAEGLDADVTQLHTSSYRSPRDIPEGTVLVVGGGNSGFQIAEELSRSHEVHLSIGSRQTPLPQRLFGRDLFWYLDAAGLIGKTRESRIGRRLRGRDTLIGSSPRGIRALGVEIHERAVKAEGSTIIFADDSTLDARTVIWATGYRLDHTWIELPIFDEGGRLVHERGVTRSPGLYFLGLTWQHTRGSALIGFVKDDAAYIAEQVRAYGRRAAPVVPERVG